MKRKLSAVTIFTLILASVFTGINIETASANPGTKIFMDPAYITAGKGESFTLDIKVENVTDLWAWAFNITIDNPYVVFPKWIAGYEGDFLKQGGDTTWYNGTDWWYYYWANCTLDPGGTPVSGSGTIAVVNLYAYGPGRTLIHFTVTELYDETFTPIAHTRENASFTMPVMNVTPRISTAAPCNNFDINITVTDIGRDVVPDLYAWEFELSFNYTTPPPINVTSITEGPFLSSAGATTFYSTFNNTAGTLYANCNLTNLAGSGASGNGTLTTITFHVEANGSTWIKFAWEALYTSEAGELAEIGHARANGYFMYPLSSAIAITDVKLSANQVVAGHKVSIYTSLENTAIFDATFNVTAYANTTLVSRATYVNVTALNSSILVLSWDTTGFKGNYRISANASLLPDELPQFRHDNNFTDGWVLVVAKPTIFVDPYKNTWPNCTDFTINITVSDISHLAGDLYGWEFKMSYNSSVLNVVDFHEGPFLQTAGNTTFHSRVNNTVGIITLGAQLEDLTLPEGATGSGTLANITFHVEANGSTCLRFELHELSTVIEYNLVPIEHDVSHGCFMYPWVDTYDIAVTDVQIPRNNVPKGDRCRIYATIKNQGTRCETFTITVYANGIPINATPTAINYPVVALPCFTTRVVGWDWDTTYIPYGNYTITVNATIVLGETDTADNVLIDGWVMVSEVMVDVTNVNIVFKKYTKPPGVIVNQGYRSWTVYIDATVHNNGTVITKYTINAYYNDGSSWVLIGTQIVADLEPCHTTILTFNWNLAGVPLCNRTVKVNATSLYGGYDEFITYFKVKGLGDVDNDGTRGVLDVINVFINAGPSPPQWVQADVDGDCSNGVLDVITIFINAGPYKCV